jgi:hypothetical protein
MNERIKDIAIKAKLISPEYNGFDPYTLSLAEKRYTELLINECCLKLLEMHDKASSIHNYYFHSATEIKKHFGEFNE